eukprot:CAMPEP_0202857426 /NCGR_PEP_ID=MMETSP1391-20130828/364_1 /ASSEMBLY_ACC=CAM_ASM_000867 /TAXON_ID=1034604 /ORGANISM="Chlamydomonas leiostraca, Strain SAG 11-49" /LENGTH=229 /DNA_ID=CAMNT_0049536221 /DNA_START=28 /DNA_END=715 /DNA_ORIENTATION=+
MLALSGRVLAARFASARPTLVAHRAGLVVAVRAAAQESSMSKKLYIGNLSWDTRKEDLSELFSKYGEVEDAFVATDRDTGRSRGFGFVTLDAGAADNAVSELNESEFMGRNIRVNEAQPQGDAPLAVAAATAVAVAAVAMVAVAAVVAAVATAAAVAGAVAVAMAATGAVAAAATASAAVGVATIRRPTTDTGPLAPLMRSAACRALRCESRSCGSSGAAVWHPCAALW